MLKVGLSQKKPDLSRQSFCSATKNKDNETYDT
jgi:hypothetical protein